MFATSPFVVDEKATQPWPAIAKSQAVTEESKILSVKVIFTASILPLWSKSSVSIVETAGTVLSTWNSSVTAHGLADQASLTRKQ